MHQKICKAPFVSNLLDTLHLGKKMIKKLAKLLNDWDQEHEFFTYEDKAAYLLNKLENMGARLPDRDYSAYISCVDGSETISKPLTDLDNL